MENEKFEEWTMVYLSGSLDEDSEKEFETYLKNNTAHQEQFYGLRQTWLRLSETNVPEPSEEMDLKFYDMLHGEIGKVESAAKKSGARFWNFPKAILQPKFAYGVLLLCLGLGFGYFLRPETTDPVQTIVEQEAETESVREQLVLTLLEQPSANQRLQGIGEANKISKVDEKVIRALLRTLNNDPNVNVRLAAIESLTNYLDRPEVREGLVQSIVEQDAPLVQITLANLMLALHEKESIEPFKTLMRTKELDTSVKQKLETTIKSII